MTYFDKEIDVVIVSVLDANYEKRLYQVVTQECIVIVDHVISPENCIELVTAIFKVSR